MVAPIPLAVFDEMTHVQGLSSSEERMMLESLGGDVATTFRQARGEDREALRLAGQLMTFAGN